MQVITRLSLVVVLLASVASLVAQEPPGSRAAAPAPLISGRVVDEATAAPLRRVHISPSDRRAEPAFTGGQGQFQIRADGSSLRLSKPGFVPLTVSRQQVEAGGADLVIGLVRGAVLTGTVFEPTGVPAIGVRVRVRFVAEETSRGRADQYAAETDDRGEFRVANLPAGRYEIDAGGGARGRGRGGDGPGGGRGGRGNRGVAAAPPPAGVLVDVRPGEEGAVALVLEPSLNAQPAPPSVTRPRGRDDAEVDDPASILGRVAGPDGAPIAGATVRAAPASGGGRGGAAASDATGRYEIAGLAAGEYRLRVSRSGYSDVEYGQTRSLQQGKALRLIAGSRVQGIDVTLPRGSVISGTVTDAWGEPLQDVDVQAMQARYVDGRTRVSPASGVRSRRTDDRGHYRVYGLLPGTYYVVASDESNRARGRGEDADGGITFYPGTPRLTEALPVRLDVGQDGIGLDMVFTPSTGVQIHGTAVSITGSPVRGRAVLGVSARYGAPLLPLQTAGLDSDGVFEFRNVSPGDYVVQVAGVSTSALEAQRAAVGRGRGGRGGGARGGGGRARGAARGGTPQPGLLDAFEVVVEREFGAQVVSVAGQNVADVNVGTSPGSVITGQVVLNGDASSTQPSSFAFAARPSDPDLAPLTGENPPRADIHDDWTFEMTGLTGPSRFELTRAPSGWYLESVDVQGVNAVVEPATFGRPEHSSALVRVVFASGAGRIDGRVTNERNEAVGEFAVVVFASNPARWFNGSPYLAFATATQDGSFSVSRLPPGEYLAVAVDRLDGGAGGGEWQRPEMLRTLAPLAERVDVGQGQPTTTNLRLVRLAS